jgi:hypothetical protein
MKIAVSRSGRQMRSVPMSYALRSSEAEAELRGDENLARFDYLGAT